MTSAPVEAGRGGRGTGQHITVICAPGAVGEWLIGLHAAAVLCLLLAIGSAWYDYRVWAFKARRFLL